MGLTESCVSIVRCTDQAPAYFKEARNYHRLSKRSNIVQNEPIIPFLIVEHYWNAFSDNNIKIKFERNGAAGIISFHISEILLL